MHRICLAGSKAAQLLVECEPSQHSVIALQQRLLWTAYMQGGKLDDITVVVAFATTT